MRKITSGQDRTLGVHNKLATFTGYNLGGNTLYTGEDMFKMTGNKQERKNKEESLTQHELGHRSLHSVKSNPETRTKEGFELLKK